MVRCSPSALEFSRGNNTVLDMWSPPFIIIIEAHYEKTKYAHGTTKFSMFWLTKTLQQLLTEVFFSKKSTCSLKDIPKRPLQGRLFLIKVARLQSTTLWNMQSLTIQRISKKILRNSHLISTIILWQDLFFYEILEALDWERYQNQTLPHLVYWEFLQTTVKKLFNNFSQLNYECTCLDERNNALQEI